MVGCGIDGCYDECPAGCGCLHVQNVDPEDEEWYCWCETALVASGEGHEKSSQADIKVISAAGETVEMPLANFIANYTPKSKLNPQTAISINCSDLDPSSLAQVLERVLPNKITVPQGIASKKLNFTLKNTTLGEIVSSSGLVLTG